MPLDLTLFPRYFSAYTWAAKHSLFCYPPDSFPKFRWITELERRAIWLKTQHAGASGPSGLYLIKDIIQWGGSQNGRLEEFEEGLGEYCLKDKVHAVIVALRTNPIMPAAISATSGITGLGPTYRSKLLRFLDPVRFGALDSRLRTELDRYRGQDPRLVAMPINFGGNNFGGNETSIVNGYVWFCTFIDGIVRELEATGITRPDCELPATPSRAWRAADVEMALFQWAAIAGAAVAVEN